jgi:hypothetical protein
MKSRLTNRQIKNSVSIAAKIAANDPPYTITSDSMRATVRLLQTTQFGVKIGSNEDDSDD